MGWLDYGVDVTAFGGYVGVGEAFAEVGDFFLAETFAFGFGGAVNFAFVDDVDCALGSHNRDFRNRGFGKSEEQFCAVADNAAKFLLRAGEKSRDVFKSDQRNIEGVTET